MRYLYDDDGVPYAPAPDQEGDTMSSTYRTTSDSEIKVGPDETGSYRYSLAGLLSAEKYHNAASAWADARRPQHLRDDGTLEVDHQHKLSH